VVWTDWIIVWLGAIVQAVVLAEPV
jgi:hypothetical protein